MRSGMDSESLVPAWKQEYWVYSTRLSVSHSVTEWVPGHARICNGPRISQ